MTILIEFFSRCGRFQVALLTAFLTMAVMPAMTGQSILLCDGQGGKVWDFDIEANMAYVVEGAALAVYDAANPLQPSLVGRIMIPDTSYTPGKHAQIRATENRVYVSFMQDEWYLDEAVSIHAIDVSQPNAPVYLGAYDTPAGASDFEARGDLLYMNAINAGLLMIADLSDVCAPAILGAVQSYGVISLLEADILYLTHPQGIEIVDISVPEAPVILGSFTNPNFGMFPGGSCLDNGKLYVASYDLGSVWGILSIYDISNPETPILLSNTSYQDTVIFRNICVSGGMVYVSAETNPETGYSYDRYLLLSFDVSDPASPLLLNNLKTGEIPFTNLDKAGGILWAAASERGIVALDISQPATPEILGPVTMGEPFDIAFGNSNLYCAGADGIRVFSLDDNDILFLDQFIPAKMPGCGLALHGDLLYVATGEAGLSVFDASQPDTLSELNCASPMDAVYDVILGEDRMFLMGIDKIAICDTTEPLAPQIMVSRDLFGYHSGSRFLYMDGDMVYISGPHGDSLFYQSGEYLNLPGEATTDIENVNDCELTIMINRFGLYSSYQAAAGMYDPVSMAFRDNEVLFGTVQGVSWCNGVDYEQPFKLSLIENFQPAWPLAHRDIAVRGEYVFTIGDQGLSAYRAPLSPVPGRAAYFIQQGQELAAEASELGLDANGDGIVNALDTDFALWDLDRNGAPDMTQLSLLADSIDDTQPPYDLDMVNKYLTIWSAVADAPSEVCRKFTSLVAGLLSLGEETQNTLEEAGLLGGMTQGFGIWPESSNAEGEPEGIADGEPEGIAEGEPEGIAEGETEGIAEGEPEGIAEGETEGIAEGEPEGMEEGEPEGIAEGEPEGIPEGEQEGGNEGEPEGENEGETDGAADGEEDSYFFLFQCGAGNPGTGSNTGDWSLAIIAFVLIAASRRFCEPCR